MAVYTSINKSELQNWLKNFSVGDLKSFKGISSGVTNTNYFVETDTTKFILTIFEQNKMRALVAQASELVLIGTHTNDSKDINRNTPSPMEAPIGVVAIKEDSTCKNKNNQEDY